jgi:hypothetical protein
VDDRIKRWGRLHDFIESARGRDVRHNAKVELATEIGKIRKDLSSFRLRSDDCSD